MMQKLLLRKFRPHRHCYVRMKPIKVGQTAKTRDDLIYTYDDCIKYRLFKVVDIEDEDYTVKEFNISPKVFRRHQTLNFSHTGVFEWHGCKPGLFIVNMSEVCGKVVMIQNLLMTVPMNVLTEV